MREKSATLLTRVLSRALGEQAKNRHQLEDQLAAVVQQAEAHRQASLHDPLTGLANRALFNDRLEHGLAQSRRQGWTLAVLFGDLNGFKAINDGHGHDAGDRVLRTVAGRLTENARCDDTVSRYGGDEFLCLLMDLRDEGAIEPIARKLISAVEAPFELYERGLAVAQPISISLGVAVFPRDGETPEALIKSADDAMYRAKREHTGLAFAGAGAAGSGC